MRTCLFSAASGAFETAVMSKTEGSQRLLYEFTRCYERRC
jgi:hypothetical protein